MEPMQWLTLILFGLTILAVITNVVDSTLAALLGVATVRYTFAEYQTAQWRSRQNCLLGRPRACGAMPISFDSQSDQ